MGNPKVSVFLVAFVILALSGPSLWAGQSDSLTLLSSPENSNHFLIEIECQPRVANRIWSSKIKMDFTPLQFRINGKETALKSINTRGKTTLNYKRKSFSISVDESIKINNIDINKFAANNLAMDRNYWRNRFCFLMMDEIDLFPLQSSFSEVVINEESQGIYLVIQKPDDYTKSIESPVLIRLGYDNAFEVDYAKGENSKQLIKLFKNRGSLARQHSGELLYQSLNQLINLDQYFKWLAINLFFLNGDYTDEVYFYYNSSEKRFNILPWDYDDVFAIRPHEGWQKRNMAMKRKMLFSSESSFDQVIHDDDFLYSKYLEVLKKTLEDLNPELLKSSFETVYYELAPLYNREEVISQSVHDQSGLTNIEFLRRDLQSHYNFLKNRRQTLLDQVQKEIETMATH